MSVWVLRFQLVSNAKLIEEHDCFYILGRTRLYNLFAQRSIFAKHLKESEIRDLALFINLLYFAVGVLTIGVLTRRANH